MVNNLKDSKKYDESFDNYLISGRFILLTIVEAGISLISVFTILYFLAIKPLGFDWGIPFSNSYVSMIYLVGSLSGSAISLWSSNQLKTKLDARGSVTLSLIPTLIILNPPFSLFAVVSAFLMSLMVIETSFIQFLLLLYGFGSGLLLARVFFFLLNSRHWSFTPNKKVNEDEGCSIISYTLSK